MEMHIIVGMVDDEKGAVREATELICKGLSKEGYTTSFDIRATKTGIKYEVDKYSSKDKKVGILLDYNLELMTNRTVYEVSELVVLQKQLPESNFVIIAPLAELKESGTIDKLFSNGFYCVLDKKDATVENIVSLLKKGRNINEARDYYCLNEEKQYASRMSMDDLYKFLMEAKTNADLIEAIRYVEKTLADEVKLESFFSRLPQKVLEVIATDISYRERASKYLLKQLDNEEEPVAKEPKEQGAEQKNRPNAIKRFFRSTPDFLDDENDEIEEKKSWFFLDKKKERDINFRGDISVFSLVPQKGVTYMAATIANILANHRLAVCLISPQLAQDEAYAKEILLKPVDLRASREFKIAKRYDCVVIDCGVIGGRTENVFGVKNIMISSGERPALRKIADWIREVKDVGNITFLFNIVPPGWKNHVFHTMNYYKGVYLNEELYDAKNPPESVIELIDEVLR